MDIDQFCDVDDSFLDAYLGELRERSLSEKGSRSSGSNEEDRLARLLATDPNGDFIGDFPAIPRGFSLNGSFKDLLPQLNAGDLLPDIPLPLPAPGPEYPSSSLQQTYTPSTSGGGQLSSPAQDPPPSSSAGAIKRAARRAAAGARTTVAKAAAAAGLDDGDSDDKSLKARRTALQEKNRRAQRRFRERQKNKVLELEAQVEELQQRVNNLMVEKANLESRNNILEKLLAMRDERVAGLQPVGMPDEGQAAPEEVVAAALEDRLVLTVKASGAVALTVEDVKRLSREDLAAFWKEYVSQLAQCLVDAGHNPEGAAAQRMEQLVQEVCMLTMRVALLNPIATKSFTTTCMEDTAAAPAISNYEMWAKILRSMNLSKQQKREMTQLRRLFLAKLFKIVHKRKEINNVLAMAMPGYAGSRQAALEFMRAHESINALRDNLRDEHLLVLDFVSTLLKHILTTYQLARCIVQAYPWTPDCLALTTWVAAEQGEADAVATVNSGTPPAEAQHHAVAMHLAAADSGALPAVAIAGALPGHAPSMELFGGAPAEATLDGAPFLPTTAYALQLPAQLRGYSAAYSAGPSAPDGGGYAYVPSADAGPGLGAPIAGVTHVNGPHSAPGAASRSVTTGATITSGTHRPMAGPGTTPQP